MRGRGIGIISTINCTYYPGISVPYGCTGLYPEGGRSSDSESKPDAVRSLRSWLTLYPWGGIPARKTAHCPIVPIEF